MVAQWVNLPASHTAAPVQVLAASLLIQLPDDASGKATEDGPKVTAIWQLNQ